MKKSILRVLAVVLSVAMIVACFAACGGKGKEEASSEESSAAAGGAAVEPGDNTLNIGVIGPLTGDTAVYGKAVQYGAQLAVDEVNAAGGINGMKIAFKAEDDENDPEKSVNAYNTLKDWGMDILVGTVTTNPCRAVADYTAQDNMFELTPSASAATVVEKGNNVFQVCFTDPNQGIASADYISDNKLATKVGVIYNSQDAYSSGIHDRFISEAKTKGLNIVSDEAFTTDNATDFSAQLNAAKSGGAELIFIPIYAKEATSILSQAKDLGITAKFFGCDGLDGILGIDGFDTSLAEGVMLLTPFSANATDDATVKFVKAYKAAGYDEANLNQFAADAYDAIYIIKAAAEKAVVKADMSVSDMGTALSKAMSEITVDGVTGTEMKWQATGEVNKTPKAIVIKNAEYIPMDSQESSTK